MRKAVLFGKPKDAFHSMSFPAEMRVRGNHGNFGNSAGVLQEFYLSVGVKFVQMFINNN